MPATSSRVAFGLFEADLDTGELWKAGRRVKLQNLPFRLLTALLERPGEVVRREELQLRLWGRNTTVDFDHSLGSAVNKIREALGDSADNPRFLETVARHGYRFIAPVGHLPPTPQATPALPTPESPAAVNELTVEPEVLRVNGAEPLSPAAQPATLVAVPELLAPAPSAQRRQWVLPLTLSLATLLLGLLTGLLLPTHNVDPAPAPMRRLTHAGRVSPGAPAMESLPAMATDGVHLFTSVVENGKPVLSQMPVDGGAAQPVAIPSEIAAPSLGDISRDGTRLLVRSHLSPTSEQPLWIVSTSSGFAERVGNVLAHDATWMPEGKRILYAAGDDLLIYSVEEPAPRRFAHLPGRAFWLRWSPDGTLLRFTLFDPVAHTWSLWQLTPAGGAPKQLLLGWSTPPNECCGSWLPDGGWVFQAAHQPGSGLRSGARSDDRTDGRSDLWLLRSPRSSQPVRLTDGPADFGAPLASADGRSLFFLGLDSASELQRFNPASHTFTPAPPFLAGAHRVEYTRDGQWVAWTDLAGHLLRARANGSELIQLTPDSLHVFLARWSPDGSRLAIMGREAGKPWQVYLLSSAGGQPEPLLPEPRNQGDPSWSADGKQIVYGRLPDLMGFETAPRALRMVDLATRHAFDIPGSTDLFSPRWSPDGRSIAALSIDERRLLLYSLKDRVWHTLSSHSAEDPVWSADSSAVLFYDFMDEGEPLKRVRLAGPSGAEREEVLAHLADLDRSGAVDTYLSGLAPGDLPLVRFRTSAADLYSLQLHPAR